MVYKEHQKDTTSLSVHVRTDIAISQHKSGGDASTLLASIFEMYKGYHYDSGRELEDTVRIEPTILSARITSSTREIYYTTVAATTPFRPELNMPYSTFLI